MLAEGRFPLLSRSSFSRLDLLEMAAIKSTGRRLCRHVPPCISCRVLAGIEVVRSSSVFLMDIKSSEVGWIDVDVSVGNLSPLISSSTSGMRTYVDLSATMRHAWKLLRLIIT